MTTCPTFTHFSFESSDEIASVHLIVITPWHPQPWLKSPSAKEIERMQYLHNENSSRKLPEGRSLKVRQVLPIRDARPNRFLQSSERDISGMTSPAELKGVENAPLPLVRVYPSVVPSTTNSFPMAISSCRTQIYSLPRSVLDTAKRRSCLNSPRRWTSWNRAISKLPLYFSRPCWRRSDIGHFPFTTDLRH